MNVRDALYEILGKECADGIIADIGVRWCIAAAMAMIQTKKLDTPTTEAFLEWNRNEYLKEP